MILENHMVLPAASPTSHYDYLKPEREEFCISCKVTGCLVDGAGWYTETYVRDDGEGVYLAGDGDDHLPDAGDTKWGWVCSTRCRSQVMYDKADPFERDALRMVHDACRVISEYGRTALSLVEDRMGSAPDEQLIGLADVFLLSVANDGNEMPGWCNR